MNPPSDDMHDTNPHPPGDESEVAPEASAPSGMPPRVSRREPYDTGETLPLESRRQGQLEAPPKLSGEQQRRTRRRRTVLAAVAVVAAIAVLAAGIGALAWIRGLEHSFRFDAEAQGAIAHALTTVHPAEETYTVLALGVDGDPADQAQSVRAILLFRITPEKVSAIALASDVAVRPQISQSPTEVASTDSAVDVSALGDVSKLGGYPAVIDTVERSLALPVNHLVVLRFSALSRMVDRLGGVWVSVPQAITAPEISDSAGAARVDAGRQLLDGPKAVTLVRAVPEDDTQIALLTRERLFVDALVATLASKESRLLGPRLAAALNGGMLSDMSSRELLPFLARLRGSAPKVESASLWGSGQGALKDLDPAAAHRLARAFLSGADLAKASPTLPPSVKPGTVTVTVRNGSGTSGLAAQVASILKTLGYRVKGVGNADQFVYDQTLIVYKSNARGAAESISKSLPVGRLVPGRGMYAFDTAVLVVVGKDWQAAAPTTDAVPIQQP